MNNIERPRFTRTRTDEERAEDKSVVIAIRFNLEEVAELEAAGKLLQQEKQSTIAKSLIEIGLLRLQDPQTVRLLELQRANIRRNSRLGIAEAEPKIKRF